MVQTPTTRFIGDSGPIASGGLPESFDFRQIFVMMDNLEKIDWVEPSAS